MKQDLKRYARMLADSGLTLGVCDWGFCVYRQEHSACFGSTTGPNPLRRERSTCASCRNFAVSAQHRAYWLEQARRHEAFLNEPTLPTQTLKIARERLKEALAMSVRSTPHRRPRVVPAPSPADRLRQALETLTASASDRPERVTVSALCQLANVSRNSLYRYHPDVLRACANTRGGKFPLPRFACVKRLTRSRPSSALSGSRLRSSPRWLITTTPRTARPRRSWPAGSRSWRSFGSGWIPSPSRSQGERLTEGAPTIGSCRPKVAEIDPEPSLTVTGPAPEQDCMNEIVAHHRLGWARYGSPTGATTTSTSTPPPRKPSRTGITGSPWATSTELQPRERSSLIGY